MTRVYEVRAGDYPVDGPVLWYARRVFEGLGWEEGPSAEAVVAFGEACVEVVGRPGVLLSPPLVDDGFVERLGGVQVPVLVVGASNEPTWSAAAAARLRTVEVLQLPRVDAVFEVPGDVPGSIAMLARLAERMSALVGRL